MGSAFSHEYVEELATNNTYHEQVMPSFFMGDPDHCNGRNDLSNKSQYIEIMEKFRINITGHKMANMNSDMLNIELSMAYDNHRDFLKTCTQNRKYLGNIPFGTLSSVNESTDLDNVLFIADELDPLSYDMDDEKTAKGVEQIVQFCVQKNRYDIIHSIIDGDVNAKITTNMLKNIIDLGVSSLITANILQFEQITSFVKKMFKEHNAMSIRSVNDIARQIKIMEYVGNHTCLNTEWINLYFELYDSMNKMCRKKYHFLHFVNESCRLTYHNERVNITFSASSNNASPTA